MQSGNARRVIVIGLGLIVVLGVSIALVAMPPADHRAVQAAVETLSPNARIDHVLSDSADEYEVLLDDGRIVWVDKFTGRVRGVVGEVGDEMPPPDRLPLSRKESQERAEEFLGVFHEGFHRMSFVEQKHVVRTDGSYEFQWAGRDEQQGRNDWLWLTVDPNTGRLSEYLSRPPVTVVVTEEQAIAATKVALTPRATILEAHLRHTETTSGRAQYQWWIAYDDYLPPEEGRDIDLEYSSHLQINAEKLPVEFVR